MRIPRATYRLQFNSSFSFHDARALVPYLVRLGISDIYASPIFTARPGSTHGYDVTDPRELNPELGTPEEFEALIAEVRARGMGWLQDIVPNHMAYSSGNAMLMDLFENGSRSRFYEFFDVFRDHPDPELRTRVLAPFLGSPVEQVLQKGEIRLVLDPEGLGIRYFDWRFPLLLSTYDSVLRHGDGRLSGSLAGDDPRLKGFLALRDAFADLSRTEDSPEKRRRLAEAKQGLARVYQDNPMVNLFLEGVLESFYRPPEGPVEQSPLSILLEQQVFKLVDWPVAAQTINYRRFFYISDFIALRVEDSKVFDTVHDRIVNLTRAGVFTGLRIDHVDGLYNPRGYLNRLRETLPDCYLVVEKILELYEFLRGEWPIEGTSGYKFCNYANSLFCRRENEAAFTGVYHRFIGAQPDYGQMLYDEKTKILTERMGGEIAYLTHLAMQLAQDDRPEAAQSVRAAMTALMAAFPVYRTYVDAHRFTEQDRDLLMNAIIKARERCPECRLEIDRIVELLLPNRRDESDPLRQSAQRHLLMRFQQFTGPAMAKGFEDTLLYNYNRLLSLNEVGGAPDVFGIALEEFHTFNERRARDWPHAMSATSTHDSKRGEDVRARLNVLSEIPERWEQEVTRWARMNEPHKQHYNGIPAPHPNDEYLLYQTLVGSLPFEPFEHQVFTQRIKDYFIKAVREAKTLTNWVQPNEPYETACTRFIDRILDRWPGNRFWTDFEAFQREIAAYGVYNSLAQTTLKMTCPGLPDFYQGADLWDLSLVDPDNRRPVDFAKRIGFLDEVCRVGLAPPFGTAPMPQESVGQAPPCQFDFSPSVCDGRIKLWLIVQGLQARRENRDLFDEGEYLPASVHGSRAGHVVAFFRTAKPPSLPGEGGTPRPQALIVVPRFLTALIRPDEPPLGNEVWRDTRIALPPGPAANWRDAITGKTLSATREALVGEILSEFPVAILLSRGP